MIDADTSIGVLNELLAAEQRSVALRIRESTVFISTGRARELLLIEQIAKRNEQHASWLVDALTKLGGAPGLRIGDVWSGDLHYQDLGNVLDRLNEDIQRLITLYEKAAARVGGDPIAAGVVNRILASHRDDASALQAQPSS